MKHLYSLLLLTLPFLGGCDGSEFHDEVKARQAVVIEFGTTDVLRAPNSEFSNRFVVRAKDGSVWYVVTNSNKVDARTQLFAPISPISRQ